PLPRPPPSTLFPYTTLFRSRSSQHLQQLAGQIVQVRIRPDHGRRAHPSQVPIGDLGHLLRGDLGDAGQRLVDGERPTVVQLVLADRKSTRLNSSHVKISYAV